MHIVIPDLEVLVWLHYESVHAFLEPGSVMGWSNLPRLTRVRATHRTSATSAGKMSALLSTFPYLCWKGSIIVTYLFSLIGLAKKKPPGAKRKKPSNICVHVTQETFQLSSYVHVVNNEPKQGMLFFPVCGVFSVSTSLSHSMCSLLWFWGVLIILCVADRPLTMSSS